MRAPQDEEPDERNALTAYFFAFARAMPSAIS